ncbi:hypothetical protein M569_12677 [Genlisea aurea]|uniref:non-specific serine/threonine protein kinase n=1 Tax=Genlisea aurea TaxID=192259 RepID=S8C5U9_9LAMI|nr:hypothetical protein M569_12677 [Genlisea aurea]
MGEGDRRRLLRLFVSIFFLISGELFSQFVAGDSLATDEEVLLQLKSFLQERNPVAVNQGSYAGWDSTAGASSPCNWPGISCDSVANRVVGIDLSDSGINGDVFSNFSALTELSYLDLSRNTIGGVLPPDLSRCRKLKTLKLCHNIISGEVNLTGLNNLEVVDLSLNRFQSDIRTAIPLDYCSLVAANFSTNNFSGDVGGIFQTCVNLTYLDLSTNILVGNLWPGFQRIQELSLSENRFSGEVPPWIFNQSCSLRSLDLSENHFTGEFPSEISNCKNLELLSLWGNGFTGQIPHALGSLPVIRSLYLGNNNFSRTIPESFTGLTTLMFLDLSRNNFGGDLQEIFGRLTQVGYLLLHNNSYTGGIYSSGVLDSPNLIRLDLSYNMFSGPLPANMSRMGSLKFLILAHNQFSGGIPEEYGDLNGLQALDLSFNGLEGSIPRSLGNLTSLLWLMLAGNSLTGEIPRELGNCSSLLWLNLADNRLSGGFPTELSRIGGDPTPTFMANMESSLLPAGSSGECLTMMRWIPADYPPFSFVYKLLTRKSCQGLWDRILRGYGLFSVCSPGSSIQTVQISGYIQLSGNRLSGELPAAIGNMRNFSMIHLGYNLFEGNLPSGIGNLILGDLNVSNNMFGGEIPSEIGNLKCLQNLDLSSNNFSGVLPSNLNHLSNLNMFNISHNPYISGVVPASGQLATFQESSFLGDPLLQLSFLGNSSHTSRIPMSNDPPSRSRRRINLFPLVSLGVIVGFFSFGLMFYCLVAKSPAEQQRYLLEESGSSSGASSPLSPHKVKVICLDKTTVITHSDILKVTKNFSDDRIIGKGGSGTVYRGVLPDGRQIAVKRLSTDGMEGERAFRAEMEVLSRYRPHPNLVSLYGWFIDGSEKLLVYEFMEGGCLEDLISDRNRIDWRRRLQIAVDVAQALVFLHHECSPSILHRDVKASNVLLDRNGTARLTDFGLARVMDVAGTHVSTTVAGTVGYVAPEYVQTWQATTKGDVYSYGVVAMELAAARRAVDGGEEECLLEWARRVIGDDGNTPVSESWLGVGEGANEMYELLKIGLRCTAERPNRRPNMMEVLFMLCGISGASRLMIS